MGSVAMSYKANSTATEWTTATEPVEIAGEGDEEFQFVATPAEGYKFAGWSDGATANPYNYEFGGGVVKLVAMFDQVGADSTSSTASSH